jgi:hypothetical protein
VEGIRFAQDQLEALYRGSRMTAFGAEQKLTLGIG